MEWFGNPANENSVTSMAQMAVHKDRDEMIMKMENVDHE